MPSAKVYGKLLSGIKELGYKDIEEFTKQNVYIGGSGDFLGHYRYFRHVYNVDCDFGDGKATNCLCGREIVVRCFMLNLASHVIGDPKYVIIGRCCIKNFMGDYVSLMNRCTKCDKPHKNRSIYHCNSCREDICPQHRIVIGRRSCYHCNRVANVNSSYFR